MTPWMRLVFACMLCMLLAAIPAQAHELRPGFLEIETTQNGTYAIAWRAPLLEGRPLAVLPEFPADCSALGEPSRERTDTAITTRSMLRCETSLAGRAVTLVGLDATLTDAIVRFTPETGPIQTARAVPENATVILAADQTALRVAGTYIRLGVEHIFSGIDHLLFVLALMLLVTGFRRLVETITAFTVAHSITLVATSLGLVALPAAPVEAVIALSIVFLAREIVLRDPQAPRLSERKPWLVAFAFGLLHGFGFAGALRAIGLPPDAVTLALLTFNIGVEIGQLVFVSICLATLWFVWRLIAQAWLETVASYAIGITATLWLIERTLA